MHWAVMGSCKIGLFGFFFQMYTKQIIFEGFLKLLCWTALADNTGRQHKWYNHWIWYWFSLQKNVKEELLYNWQHSRNTISFSCRLWYCLCRKDHTSTDGSPHYQQNIWKASLLLWLPSKWLTWMHLFHSSSRHLCFQKTGNILYLSLLCLSFF